MPISTASHPGQRSDGAAARRREPPWRLNPSAAREIPAPPRMEREQLRGEGIADRPRNLNVTTRQCHGEKRQFVHAPTELQTAMVSAVAHALWQRYGGRHVHNWIEAEQIVDPLLQSEPFWPEQ